MTSKELHQKYLAEQAQLSELQAKVVARLTWLEGAITALDELEKESTNADTV